MPILDPELVRAAPIRIDGRAKVTGTGMYTGDFNDATLRPYLHPNEIAKPVLHAATVSATIANGHIRAMHVDLASRLSGVRLVMTHENAPRLKSIDSLLMSEQSKFTPLQSNRIFYHGQPIALVVADSLEIAKQAAALVQVDYAPETALVDFDAHRNEARPVKKVGSGKKAHDERGGDPEQSFRLASVRVDSTYDTGPAHHNAIEPGSTLAHWHPEDGELNRLTILSSTQFVYGDAIAMGEAFDLGRRDAILRIVSQVVVGKQYDSRVRVIAPLVGGGFGSKGGANHTLLAAMAARQVGHPVKLVLTRPNTFSQMPYRGGLAMRMRLGADISGRLQSLQQDTILQSGQLASFLEPTGEVTPHLYAVPDLRVDHRALYLNANSPGWMRAPGVAPGQFALECAMDELAGRIGIDPVELRLRNYAEADPQTGKLWSSKSLRECYAVASQHFGWERRQPRSTECEGDERIGYGMATAAYRANQFPATARVTYLADGSVLAQSATQEIGQGAITSLSQVVAETLALPLDRIRLEIGDTTLPFGAFSAGSSTSLSVGSALQLASQNLGRELARIARVDKASPLYQCALNDIVFTHGVLRHRVESARVEAATELLRRNGRDRVEAKGVAGRTFGKSKWARFAFGAQFVRVAVSQTTGVVRVTQMTSAFAAGRILNARTARSQLLGGMVWGIGHALMEHSVRERHSGGWLNSNLAEAHVPVNADIADLEAILIDEDDSRGSELGAKGLGEIGIVGVAAAIANAVYNATGRRIRQLPITPDLLL